MCEVLKWIARGRLRPKHALMIKMLAGENPHEWRYFEVTAVASTGMWSSKQRKFTSRLLS